MSRPLCTRIEITYADGSKNVAQGDSAESIIKHLEFVQAIAASSDTLIDKPPQFAFLRPGMGEPLRVLFGAPE